MKWRIQLGLATGLLFASTGLAEVVLTPELQAIAGYDSNRYREPDNASSDGFFEVVPALQLSWFSSETTEWRARGQYSGRNYLSSTNGQMDTLSVEGGFSRLCNGFSMELFAGGGTFKDSELPADDMQWLQVSPFIGYTFVNGLQISLRGYLSQNTYDSRLTYDGDDETGQYGVIRPGFNWPASMKLNVWGEVYAEQFSANEPVDEYSGLGVTVGLDYDVTPLFRISGSAWTGSRDYPNEIPDLVESRTDNPSGAALSARYRLTDWLALQMQGGWERVPSTNGNSEYDQWTVQMGITIAQDFSLH